MRKHLRTIAVIGCGLSLMTGCDGGSERGSTPAGQVVAKVNESEISIHQVNFELANNPRLRQIEPKMANDLVVTQLAQQEVLVQKAKQAKLDRDPQVMQAIESAKRKVLARAYMQRAANNAVPPTPSDVSKYVHEHPEFFDKRRVYQLQELLIDKNSVDTDALRKKVDSNVKFKDILVWLKENNARIRANQGVKAAEQLPLASAKALLNTKTTQVSLVDTNNALYLYQIMAIQEQPMASENFNKSAENFLMTQSRKKAAIEDAKMAYDIAKIEFLGQFAHLNQQVASPAHDMETEIGVNLNENETGLAPEN